MEMKTTTLEISAENFRKPFGDEPQAAFDKVFGENYEAVARKIAHGEFFRFWSRQGIILTVLEIRARLETQALNTLSKCQWGKYFTNNCK